MRISNSHLRPLAAAILVILVASPIWAARGSADFTRYVALGDSYGAGFVSGALLESHQKLSYPSVIARQAGTSDFQIPSVSEPGIPAELELRHISPLTIVPKSTSTGFPTNLMLPRPYNNLSVPGANAGDLLTVTGDANSNPIEQIILRGLGTQVQQALALQPTFISVWIGGNDILGAATSGIVIDGVTLTPIDQFEQEYNAIIDLLTANAPNAGMVLGILADVSALPFGTTIPPFIVDPATGQPLIIVGSPVYYIADLGGGQIGPLPPGSLVNLTASALLSQGFGIPTVFGGNGMPLPDNVVLTPHELATISERLEQFNDVIFAVGAKHDIPVVDFNSFFNDVVKDGLHYGGIEIGKAFLTGGLFSYDGVHPTDLGYSIIANEFIRTINGAYGSDIPFTSITNFYANNNRRTGRTFEFRRRTLAGAPFEFTYEAWENLLKTLHATQSFRMPNPVF